MTELEKSYNSGIIPTNTIDSYPSAALSKEPLLYPGIRPERSFLLDGKDVYTLSADNTDDILDFSIESLDGVKSSLNTYLAEKGVPRMEDRIPVLAYGANMCPASIYSKFDKIGREDAHIVPTLYGHLDGYDVVWSGGPGMNGNFIANLYKGEETRNTSVTIGVNFLTPEQLLVMHATEMSYDLATVDVDIEGVTVKALVYIGVDQILMRDGHPVAVEGIKTKEGTRGLKSRTTRELVDWMVTLPEIQAQLAADGASEIANADGYIENTRQLVSVNKSKPKTARKQAIHKVFSDMELSQSYKLPIPDSALRSWSNPSSIPTYGEQLQGVHAKNLYVLPDSELAAGAWPDAKKRNKVLIDLGTHYLRMTGLKEVDRHEG